MSNLAPILNNHVFCCTGLSAESKTIYQRKIEALRGRMDETVSEACHCLLGNPETIIQSPKYLYALNANIPVIQVAWIDECWQHVHISSATPSDQLKYLIQLANSKFIINGLMGCRISVSGFALEERYRIRDLIHSLRGVYCADFMADCTHLVVNDVSTTTTSNVLMPKKLEMAKKWSIPVVKAAWLEACDQEKKLIDWQPFITEGSNDNRIDFSSQSFSPEEIDENCAPFLSDCHIYMDANAPAQLHLKRIILAAGGARYTDLSTPCLTHALIHQQVMPAELPRQLAEGVVIVHDSWVQDSYTAKRRLPEDPYLVKVNNKPAAVNASFNASLLVNTSFSTSFIIPAPSTMTTQLSTPTVISKRNLLSKEAAFTFHSYPRQPEAWVMRAKKLLAKAKRLGVNVSREPSKADFSVLPCVVHEQLNNANSAITDVLFESLLDALKGDASATVPLLAQYARPVRLKRKGCLNGCIFSQTGFTGAAREFNVALVEGAGATYTDNLSKQNTHLLVDENADGTGGIKREFAKKWEVEEVGVRELMRVLTTGGELKNGRAGRVAVRAVKSNSVPNPLEFEATIFSSQLADVVGGMARDVAGTIAGNNTLTGSTNATSITNATSTDKLFKGLVFAFSQRLHHRRDQLTTVLETHGASVLWSLSAHCTHYLHQGNQLEECFREFKQARQWGCKIISPVWVEESVRLGRLKDEFEYPHTFKRTVDEDRLSQPASQPSQSSQKSIIQAQAQENTIDWNAIVREREERAAQLRPRANIDFSSFNVSVSVDASKSVIPLNEASVRFTTPLYFIFSGFTAPQKESLRSQLPADERLIVTAETAATWSPLQSVLLVADSITASEKFFSACASGSWVMRKEFVTEYLNSVGSLDELLKAPLQVLEGFEVVGSGSKYGVAARFWRRRGGKAFEGWRVWLDRGLEERKLMQFKGILLAGGAIFTDTFSEATHVIGNVEDSRRIDLNSITSYILNQK